jgi:omega-hydroxy-beta-dihydromenaquinone-9 sulfotransferase
MTHDDRFVYMKLAHTIFPSVSFTKLYKLLSFIDRKTGHPLKWLMKKFESLFFSGWKDIHPLAFNKAEEDEGIYTFALISPAVFLAFPFLHLVKESWLLDNEEEKVKRGIMNYYENCLKRFVYAQGKNKIYLSKNVLSSGRINCLMKRFPDARVVYAVRNPYEALPSFISMFGAMYPALRPSMKDNDEAMKAWAFLGIAFYKHFNEARKNMAANNLAEVKYDDLVAEPSLTIEKIYTTLQFDTSSAMKERLAKLEERNKNYKSRHYYSLEQYGLSKDYIYGELKFLFDQFDFKQ